MSWRDRLAILLVPTRTSSRHMPVSQLRCGQAGFLHRARYLRLHAAQAPSHPSRDELNRLAAEDEQHARCLAVALSTVGAEPLPPAEAARATNPLNHWGRLVQDLEAHRHATSHLREQGIRVAQSSPDTAALLERLAVEEQEHAIQLRDLIARSDPHALN